MIFTRKCLLKFPPILRYCTSSQTIQPILSNFDFKLKLNNEQQEKILKTLNNSGQDELLQFNVPRIKIKNLESYKNKNGPFQSLEEILEVDGLSVKLLEKLCEKIISNKPETKVKKLTNNKRLRQFLAPSLPDQNIETSVGIHLAPMGISWAKLVHQENCLQCWGYQNFTDLPKKMLPTDTFMLANAVLNKIPSGDLYVFEGTSSMGLQGQKQPSTVTSYNNQLELTSMLLALLNTSTKHNASVLEKTGAENKVYFLRSKLPARLFKTLVGNECVSSTATVSQLIDSSSLETFSLPCSRINLEPKLKIDYLSKSSAHKELLGQALMLIVAFANLCVEKNPVSLNAVIPGKK